MLRGQNSLAVTVKYKAAAHLRYSTRTGNFTSSNIAITTNGAAWSIEFESNEGYFDTGKKSRKHEAKPPF